MKRMFNSVKLNIDSVKNYSMDERIQNQMKRIVHVSNSAQ